MDELAKTEARNYLCAAGFFMIAAWFLLSIFLILTSAEVNDFIHIALGIGLLIVATLLIVLHKRDMIAILFFLIGAFQLYMAFTSFGSFNPILIGFILFIALIILTGQDKKKWMLFLIPAIWFVMYLINVCFGYNFTQVTLVVVFFIILAVLCLYYAFCCACERISLPGAKILTADAKTDFKSSGSVLGYMLFAAITGGYALHYLLGEAVLPIATFVTIELLCGALMVFVAILLLTVGQMRFTPIMFLLLGITNILAMYSTGAMFIGLGILYIVIGLFAMLRKESRILPGIMLVVYGCTAFFSGLASSMPSAPVVSIILNAIPCLIAIYLSFVVYSQRKLPKF